MSISAALWLMMVLHSAIPPLTADQRSQLASADESVAFFDQGALYPLLFNSSQWTPGDETGAAIPDYFAMLQAPADQRGSLFLIEAEYLDTSPPLKLARPGPWEPSVRRWLVRPRQKPDLIIAVMLVNPPEAPKRGQFYRMPARFYRLINDTREGAPQKLLPLLVGHGAVRVGSGGGGGGIAGAIPPGLPLLPGGGGSSPGAGVSPWALAVVVAIGLASLLFLVRRVLALRGSAMGWGSRAAREREREREEEARARAQRLDDDGPPLPADPAEAMLELERRHQRELDEAFERVRQGLERDATEKPSSAGPVIGSESASDEQTEGSR